MPWKLPAALKVALATACCTVLLAACASKQEQAAAQEQQRIEVTGARVRAAEMAQVRKPRPHRLVWRHQGG